MIKKKLLKSLSSIMFFTGSKSNDNALAAENRNYGYEDETLGTLNKDKDYNLYWSYMSDEKFSAREQCLNFKRMEIECKRFAEKKK